MVLKGKLESIVELEAGCTFAVHRAVHKLLQNKVVHNLAAHRQDLGILVVRKLVVVEVEVVEEE